MNGVRPVVRNLIMCEDIVLDPTNPRRVTLVALIGTIRALKGFPVRYSELCAYVQMTECRGTGRIRIEIVQADSGLVVFRTRIRRVSFGNDPLEAVGIPFRIRDCRFPAAGLYWVQFWYNEVSIAQ